ncbi:probable cryptochrome DASH [Cyanidioschyzon merolae strain 10D]|jgi:deoxyribodipyrimidine photo-lyase|uniref:Cryptochrome DASH n=1 Tax=Cyanidioschyzon merolae (strain NIES-3377 / 10D) TaxID=280699 RepID=M1V828_CYAM1|nr:probable cryptochrome DASH [Cyanidioschyzon merolae strain 10D]BAM80259.1 probable cryptochrome DASH [Cyanidioschyzon merolae strain 10D]|eukprot:XP_005534866.1 probable cryptochrome DASH [Cyanidioschyzon merolae strain 10D]
MYVVLPAHSGTRQLQRGLRPALHPISDGVGVRATRQRASRRHRTPLVAVQWEWFGWDLDGRFEPDLTDITPKPEKVLPNTGTTYADSLVFPTDSKRWPDSLPGTALLWFRNDLRLHDNEALRLANRAESLLCVYVFDERYFFGKSRFGGFLRIGEHRAYFLRECIVDLRQALRSRGQELIVEIGSPVDVIPRLVQKFGVQHLIFSKEVTEEEIATENALVRTLAQVAAQGQISAPVQCHAVWNATLVHIEDLPYPFPGKAKDISRRAESPVPKTRGTPAVDRVFPDTFTTFRRLVERSWTVRETWQCPEVLTLLPDDASNFNTIDWSGALPIEYPAEATRIGAEPPKLLLMRPYPDPRACYDFHGGETVALSRLEDWIWETQSLASYKETRNGLEGPDYSSKFSCFLAHGCISPRLIYNAVRDFERRVESNESTYWLLFELLWRDFFRFTAVHHGNAIFKRRGLRGVRGASKTSQSGARSAVVRQREDVSPDARLTAWCQGRTGVPFIDAAMRELRLTGFMSNRARQVVASFLINDLGLDWRLGAEWFESQLLDYDPCSNWGNWCYLAGVGNDPRSGSRYFHPLKQAYEFDPRATFTKRWCPELFWVDNALIQTPWKWNRKMQEAFRVTLGDQYPEPIVTLREPGRARTPPKVSPSTPVDTDAAVHHES